MSRCALHNIPYAPQEVQWEIQYHCHTGVVNFELRLQFSYNNPSEILQEQFRRFGSFYASSQSPASLQSRAISFKKQLSKPPSNCRMHSLYARPRPLNRNRNRKNQSYKNMGNPSTTGTRRNIKKESVHKRTSKSTWKGKCTVSEVCFVLSIWPCPN